jgi:anion-transporting  ArsA/GET3 family ATPase
MSLDEIVAGQAVLVCCGSGGVGKTTVAAALALGGAYAGRRVCVVTIDPARRLADALAADVVVNSPHEIEGPWSGSLSAVMLDAKVTFDDLVHTYAADEEQASRILENRVYRNLVSALSGTQEYMATEKLFELHTSGAFDLVVVDTPPSRNALDFLTAPGRLTGFLDNRIFRLLLMPGRAYVRAVSVGTQLLLRTLSKVAGSEIVEDTMTFFQAFDGMEQGFRDRAAAVTALLNSQTTSFILVAAPHDEAMREARYFAEQLHHSDQAVAALIMNRVLPDLGEAMPLEMAPDSAWGELVANLNDLSSAARREQVLLDEVTEALAPASIVTVPLLPSDVHDIASLTEVAHHLLPAALP